MEKIELLQKLNDMKKNIENEIQELSPNSNYQRTNLKGQIKILDIVISMIIDK